MPSRNPEIERFLKMAQGIASETGHALLFRLVDSLSEYLNAAFVAVTYGEGRPVTHARALYALKNQEAVHDVRYALEGTPCKRVYAGEVLTVPCKIAELYPREAGYKGYIGIPLHDDDGGVAGHLVIFTTEEILKPEFATAICRLFSLRAEAELRRIAAEAERKRLISDLSRLNARLQSGYSELRRENERRTELIGLIAHDLRSPLSALLSQAELGLSRTRMPAPDGARIEAAFQKVIANADRIAGLIDATLERARDEGKVLNLHPRLSNLVGLVGVAVEANREDAERKSISLSITSDCDITADVDETLITSAIDNLVSNAVKFTHPGGSVQVAVETEGKTATVAVSDTGQGLTPDDLLRVFGRFQTLSARPTGGERSTGLGLANVREIAQAHGGTVHAESEGKGKGSRFLLVLPCKPSAQSDAQLA